MFLFLSLNMFKIHCMSNVHVCLLCLCPVADGGVLVGPVRVDVDDPLYHLFDDVTGQQCATQDMYMLIVSAPLHHLLDVTGQLCNLGYVEVSPPLHNLFDDTRLQGATQDMYTLIVSAPLHHLLDVTGQQCATWDMWR